MSNRGGYGQALGDAALTAQALDVAVPVPNAKQMLQCGGSVLLSMRAHGILEAQN